jgi:hypothetical protein
MTLHGDRRVKLFATVSVWLLVGAVALLALAGPARGYEISLYRALPTAFWICVVGAVLVAQVGLLARAFDETARGRGWVVLLYTMLLTVTMLLVVSYVRGYPVYGRADVLTHVGFARGIDIVGTASSREFYPNDIYPNIHLLVLTLSYATGLDPLHVINGINPFITFSSIAGVYLLLAEVYGNRRQAIAGAAIAALPIGTTAHLNSSPYAQSVLLVPLVLYLFVYGQRTSATAPRVALVVALVSLVLYHPLTAFLVLFVFGAYVLVGRLGVTDDSRSPAVAGYVTVSAFATWYLQFAGIVFKFRDTFERLVGTAESGGSSFDSYTSTVDAARPAILDLLRVASLRYGIPATIIGLLGIYVLFALNQLRRGKLAASRATLAVVGSALLFTGLSAVLFVVSLPLDYTRPLLVAVYLALVPAGLAVSYLWVGTDRVALPPTEWWRPTLGRAVVVGAVLTLTFVTLFAFFYSPLGSLENHQVTRTELDGSAWVFDHRDGEVELVTMGWGARRHHDAHFGVWADPSGSLEDPGVPEHFNYTVSPRLGESYAEDTYLFVSAHGRDYYPEKFPDYEDRWAFTPADFARLDHDTTVRHVYDNGGFDGYVVAGAAPATADPDPPAAVQRARDAAPDV